MWGARLSAHANADELDFSDDVAVAAIVLPHENLQMREALEVFDEGIALAMALAGVPALVRLDEADHAAVAGEVARTLVGKPGDKVDTVLLVASDRHSIVIVTLGGEEGGVDFGNVGMSDSVG